MGDPDGNKTYTRFDAALSNTGQRTTRRVSLVMSLEPATAFKDVVIASGPVTCAPPNGARLSCVVDKLLVGETVRVRVSGEAPPQPGVLTNIAVFGWDENTDSTRTDVRVEGSGTSWIPPCEDGAPECPPTELFTGDRVSDQEFVNSQEPLWASVTLPPQSEGYSARVYVETAGPELVCPDGFFPGTVFLCRDIDSDEIPNGQPRRWVALDVSRELAEFGFKIAWDVTIVSPRQQPAPSAQGVQAVTGVPPFAIFHNWLEDDPQPETQAFADSCLLTGGQPPCLDEVTESGTPGCEQAPDPAPGCGDWLATGRKAYDGPPERASSPLAPLLAVLDYLVGIAYAQSVPSPNIMR